MSDAAEQWNAKSLQEMVAHLLSQSPRHTKTALGSLRHLLGVIDG